MFKKSGPGNDIWKFEIRNGEQIYPEQPVQPETSNQILWADQSRLSVGCCVTADPQIVRSMNLDELELSKFHASLADVSMPVQDAINLAEFLMDMTKKYFAFLPGADIMAGDTGVDTVTKNA